MANNLNFVQCSALLAAVNAQATGRAALAPVNTSEFVAMATSTLEVGYDPVIHAISQVLSKTVFSVRPYTRKFKGLFMDSVRWGNHVRKLQMLDSDPKNDGRYERGGGVPYQPDDLQILAGVDQQAINKPKVYQTNFYGASVYERSVTIFKDQLDVAFSSPEEFGRFVGMVLQNVSDLIEQDHENMARMTVANFIAAKSACDGDNMIHLLTEYNNEVGGEFTAATIRSGDNFTAFMRWAYARIKTVSDMMTERTAKYHKNPAKGSISRHTPKARQKMYLRAADVNNMESRVLSVTFHDQYLKGVDFETVNFWQSIDSPDSIKATPSYVNENFEIVNDKEVTVNNVFGVLFDEEAMGVTTVNTWTATAPFNARGGYQNTFWHFTDRYYNDLSENGVVFLLD